MLDIKWNPFIENIIASCSEDTSVSRNSGMLQTPLQVRICEIPAGFFPRDPKDPFFYP